MGKTQEIICAIEFGTSKISVLFGSIDSDQTMQVEGFGSIPSMNAIVKGEITDMAKATELLEKAINQADKNNLINKENIKKVTTKLRYGGGCVNDVVVHLATPEMPFGGVGASGIGSYHGKFGFDTFSHKKSILDKKTWFDLPLRYQPYNNFILKLLKLFLK